MMDIERQASAHGQVNTSTRRVLPLVPSPLSVPEPHLLPWVAVDLEKQRVTTEWENFLRCRSTSAPSVLASDL